MIFSLFAIVLLIDATSSSKTYRATTRILESGEAYWGTWSAWTYCNKGKYAKGFWLKVEPNQGNGDDTAANGFQLICDDGEELSAGNDAPWGTYSSKSCPYNSYLKGFRSKVEPNQNELHDTAFNKCDDTALNAIRGYCTGANNIKSEHIGVILSGDEIVLNNNGWGDWGVASFCPGGSVVCGFKQRVEGKQGQGLPDDTALNAVQLACCSSPKVYSEAEGYWAPVVRGNSGLKFERSVTIGIVDYSESKWSETNTVALESKLSASMSFTYSGVGGDVTSSLTATASKAITSGSLSSVTRTFTDLYIMACNSGYVALYQYVTSVKESALNQNSDAFEIKATDYWCSKSGKPPQCPYLYCSPNSDCQTCTTEIFV